VIEAYQHSIKKAELYGPTHFSEIIAEVNARCEATEISAYN